METKRCPKCGLTIYVKDDGTEVWTCVHNPNYKPPVTGRRNKLISVNDLMSGDYCDAYTLGHIFATGKIAFAVPPHGDDAFREMYFSVKEREVPENASVYFNDMSRSEKWGNSSKVVFEKNNDVVINTEYKINDDEKSDNKVYVARNEFTWYLLNMGMDVDDKHDVKKALSMLDNEDDKNDFMKGFAGI